MMDNLSGQAEAILIASGTIQQTLSTTFAALTLPTNVLASCCVISNQDAAIVLTLQLNQLSAATGGYLISARGSATIKGTRNIQNARIKSASGTPVIVITYFTGNP